MLNHNLLLLFSLLVLISPSCSGFAIPNAPSHPSKKIERRRDIVRNRMSSDYQSSERAILGLSSNELAVNNALFLRAASLTSKKMTTTLRSQENDNDTSKENNGKNTEANPPNRPLSDAFDTILLLFSYCTQFFGAAVSVGLILNLCGYGYTFDFKDGLYIDKIENIRQEVQFRREIQRSAKESISKVQKTLPSTVEESSSPLLPR